ncbi:regulatory iron-sulfur-containing complex subunit RicT [Crocinitomicaceae bacterium]|nr:regulatory iron-sulfur-containing complex subunit RicT [Crocinitomicaceae bacterium]
MGCSSCSTGGGTPRGCKNNGTCSSGGCDKLGVFDWLANMQLPSGKSQFDILEIRFKNSRKAFYRNIKGLSLNVGDVVVVESSPGHDVGVVSIVGELARIQVQKKAANFKPHEARQILRIATQEDVDKWVAARGKEYETMHQSREMAIRLNLEMKISDVEFQGDGSKATFYYTADGRVDFRQLIKDMADTFRVRIEMRQIGARQESSRLGGIGSCGRELCCSTWLTDFRSVSTSAARYQQLSLNPQKLAGQCGKLKCCLNFELDMYLEAVKGFPSTNIKLYTKKGSAFHIKTDVFKRLMWYIYESDEPGASGMIALTPERVAEVIKMNKAKENPIDLKDFKEEIVVPKVDDYTNVVGQDDLSRFDNVFKKKRKKKKKPRPQNQNNKPQAEKKPQANQPKAEGEVHTPKPNNRNRNKRRKPRNPNNSNNNDKKE